MKRPDKLAAIIKASQVWENVDPALLDEACPSELADGDPEIAALACKVHARVRKTMGGAKEELTVSERTKPAVRRTIAWPRTRFARVAYLAAALILVLGLGWLLADLPGWISRPSQTSAATTAGTGTMATTAATTAQTLVPTNAGGLYVPRYEWPDDYAGRPEQPGIVIYRGRVYVQAGTTIDDEHARTLRGRYLGTGTGSLEGWESQGQDTDQLASSEPCAFYTVTGYEEEFRIMGIGTSPDSAAAETLFYECLNDLLITSGRDVFGRLNLQNLDLEKSDTGLQDVLDRLLSLLDQAEPVFWDSSTGGSLPDESSRMVIDFSLQDGCQVGLALFSNGYAYYPFAAQRPVVFKISDDAAYASIWQELAETR